MMTTSSPSDIVTAVRKARGDAIWDWWHNLYPKDDGSSRGDAGGRARLRRAEKVHAVQMEEPFILLGRDVQEATLKTLVDQKFDPNRQDINADVKEVTPRVAAKLAIIAALLADIEPSRARVSEEDADEMGTQPRSFMWVLGAPLDSKADKKPLLSALRFSAVLSAMQGDETDRSVLDARLAALRRTLPLAKGKSFQVMRLVGDILNFTDDTALRWSMNYRHVAWVRTPKNAKIKTDSRQPAA